MFATLRMGTTLKSFMLFALLAFGSISSVAGAPTRDESLTALQSESTNVKRVEGEGTTILDNVLSQRDITSILTPSSDKELHERESAGLYWGPKYLGNLKLYITHPHMGYAGPKFPKANHINVHVDKKGAKNKYKEVVNLHVVKYKSGAGKQCLYIWDSVTSKVVFDKCFDDFEGAIAEGVSAIKSFVEDLLKAANFFAAIVIIALLVVALTAAIGGLALA
ncbi:hypothetical protein B7463_g733, partial [Scytalidium lignicola]